MKWGRVFPPDCVNVLYAACCKHMAAPFRFVCLTDDAKGFVAGIEALPIPDIGLRPDQWYTKGVWPKLALYVADLHGLTGRCLFIDLDMVIVGGLDDFFSLPGRFISTDMGDGWQPGGRAGAQPETGTCIFAYDLGRETPIIDRFQREPEQIIASFRNEQDYVGAMVEPMGFWPAGWVISFKRFLRQPVGADLFRPPRAAPVGTRVIAFHGDPRPQDLLKTGFWDRFPHMGHGRVDWMVRYWRENGGKLPGR